MKATANLLGYKGLVNIIEETTTGYEIELLEGTLKGKIAYISKSSSTETITLNKKVTAKIEKSGHNEDSKSVAYYITCNDKNTLLNIVNYITNNSSDLEELGSIDHLYDDVYSSGVVAEYYHGMMTTIDKEAKRLFKEAKKVLGAK